MDIEIIRSAILPSVVLFQKNGTAVDFKTDGIEFTITQDMDQAIHFWAKPPERKSTSLEFTKRPYTPQELINAFAMFILDYLDQYYKDYPSA